MRGVLIRIISAAIIGALAVADASAEDNGPRLFDLFEKTCARKPVSGEALNAQARELGYVHQNGPVAPDDPKRDPDDINFWTFPDQGSNFAIDAYFGGPRANYRVSCSLHAVDVAFPAFIEQLKRETTLPDQQPKSNAETGSLTYIWTAEADGGQDTLEVAAYKNGRVRIAFSYDVITR